MNDGPFVDEADKNARRIFYPSLTNSGNLRNSDYSHGYRTYIFGYAELIYLQILLFIIGTKLSIQSQPQNLLCKMSKIISRYNFGFRYLVDPVLEMRISPLAPG